MFTLAIYGKASYQYFGQHDCTGCAGFHRNPCDQDLMVTAHGLFVGAGYIHNLTDRLYLDASGEVDMAFCSPRQIMVLLLKRHKTILLVVLHWASDTS